MISIRVNSCSDGDHPTFRDNFSVADTSERLRGWLAN
jgi:hypothetical protein